MGADRPSLGPPLAGRTPTVREEELGRGLRALAVRRSGVPLVELRLVFPLGGGQLAHAADPLVLSESILSGTERHDRASLAAAFGRLGASLGAALSGDCFVVSGSVLAGNLVPFLALVGEILLSSRFPAAEVAGDRARTADEVTLVLSRPETIAAEALAKRIYGRHPYGAELPRPDAISKVTAPQLRRLHAALVRPGAAHLVLVGDVQPARALRAAESAFSEWLSLAPGKAVALAKPPPVEPGGIELIDRPGSVQSNLRLGGTAPSRASADWPAMALANALLGGMFSSRIVENLRERNGYTYSPRSTIEHLRAGSSFSLSAEVSTGVTAASLVEARYELARIATTGVKDEELEGARRYVLGTFAFRTATQAGLASTLATLAASGVSPGYLKSYPAQLARARRLEVSEAASRYYAPVGLVTVIVGDADAAGPQLALVDEIVSG